MSVIESLWKFVSMITDDYISLPKIYQDEKELAYDDMYQFSNQRKQTMQ